MIPELGAGIDARFIFVVGKGGVGKTTTAAALALAFADRGLATYLVSTDPAHSLADVLEQVIPGEPPVASACAPLLLLEEFGAEAYARRWFRDTAGLLAELVERGTYLDGEDVRRFLDLALPGIDEVMAAFRLAELADRPLDRIVVDTAPTGHMLRLLEAGATIRSWVEAFRAMAEKAAVVASRLARRPVRLAGEAALDDLEARALRFERSVLGASGFVVVSRGSEVVRAETARLSAELARRGLAVAAEVRVDGGPAPRGCEGLRRLSLSLPSPDAATPSDAATPPRSVPPERRGDAAREGEGVREREGFLIPSRSSAFAASPPRRVAASGGVGAGAGASLFDRELLLFAGKGGVGKSTCAAACALALSQERPVALYGTDPAGSLGDVLAAALPPEGLALGPNLFVRQVDARVEFEAFRARGRQEVAAFFERIGLDREAALDRRVVESLWQLAPPGLDEVYALLAILDAVEERRTLVIDAAPTGHFLRLIELPGVALDWTHALMRILVRYRAVSSLDESAGRLLRLAKQLRNLRSLLADPRRTGGLVVTLDEPVVRAETERLLEALRRAAIPVMAVLRNRVPARGRSGEAGGPAAVPGRMIAPLCEDPPVGAEALRAFFARWELVT